jgi:acyl carrier protein
MFVNQTQVTTDAGDRITTATTAKPKTPAAFRAQTIETSIREFLAEQGAMQAVLHGVGPQPVVDSLVIVELLLELETQVPFELPESLAQGWRIRQRG